MNNPFLQRLRYGACQAAKFGLLIILAGVLSPAAMAANGLDAPFSFLMPSNQEVIILAVWLLVLLVAYMALYRLFLKSQIRKGVHPKILSATLVMFCIGVFLLVLFVLLFDSIGWAIFAIIGSVFLFILLMLLFMGKVLKVMFIFLVIALAVVIYQYMNMMQL